MQALSKFFAVAVVGMMAVAPAAATTVFTVNLGGSASNAASFAYTAPGSVNLTAQARSFSVLPTALTTLSQIAGVLNVSRTTPGIGVDGGASAPQLDTNQASRREGILLTSDVAVSLRALKLSFIDNDDTLQVYGVNGNQLVSLGYPGVVRAGLTGPNAGLSLLAGQATGPAYASGTNSGTQTLTLVDPTARFTGFFFTTREPGNLSYLGTLGQGFRIDSLTLGVPEPASWAMLIAGFGLVGAASRRRRTVVAA
jgi:hypothetical protein